MDSRSAVMPAAAKPRSGEGARAAIRVDHAIFTSVRSTVARGYRVVACSPGVTVDERKHIVQMAPSHNSMCLDEPHARGLASFPLPGGRHCVMLVRHAGLEPSGRGGFRVHSHVLLIEPRDFTRKFADPLLVEVVAGRQLDPAWTDHPPVHLESLFLPIEKDAWLIPAAGAAPYTECDAAGLAAVLSAVMSRKHALVLGCPDESAAIVNLLAGIPAWRRQTLSLSFGLRFGPSRAFELVFTHATHAEADRILTDHDYVAIDWTRPQAAPPTPFDPWIRYSSQCWQAGRRAELNRLAASLTTELPAPTLAAMAQVASHLDVVATADENRVDELLRIYAGAIAMNEVHGEMIARLRDAAETRKAAMVAQKPVSNRCESA